MNLSFAPSLGKRLIIFLKRIRHCAGFGVQSPTDYAFVREVIYERWPYALYTELEARFRGTDRFLLKSSQLLLRVSNYAQASRIGVIGNLPPVMEAHLKAGCRKSEMHIVIPCAILARVLKIAQHENTFSGHAVAKRDRAILIYHE